ncbi:MAG: hypothetical protein AcusKO_36160 [Acuticoccus sp.]
MGIRSALRAVVEERSYSRISGLMVEEMETGRSGRAFASASASASSCTGLTKAFRRQTATASASSRSRRGSSASMVAAASGVSTVPSARIRSATPRRRSRAISGGSW